MTKAILCTTCNQIVGPRSGNTEEWTFCAKPCMHSAVRWRDPKKGILEVTSFHGSDGLLILGLHNGMLHAAMARHTDEQWRDLHEDFTKSPGYLFDESKRACWAVALKFGDSNDVWFMDYQEAWAQHLKYENEDAQAYWSQVTIPIRQWAAQAEIQEKIDWAGLGEILDKYSPQEEKHAD